MCGHETWGFRQVHHEEAIVFGLIGVVIALVVLTIALAGVFLVRPSITVGATGKILAFVSLCVLPVLCIITGMSFHMQRSQQTSSCISCHSMASHGQSLHLEDPKYIPAQHFQNHFVPPDKACYTCHTDYTIYGPWKSRLDGLRYVYMTYLGTVPKTIHYRGKYSNLQCLHCHAGARDFEEHLSQMPPIGELTTNRISCLSSGCHDMIHNASEVGHLKMWNAGAASTAPASGSSSPAPTEAEQSPTAGPSKAKAGSTAGGATSTRGKAIFDSHRCSGCHGESGGGGSGPALTHISSQYPPAKLTALLKSPTAKMKAAGMVPLTLSAADMKSLVSYVSSLGGASAAPAAKPASGSSSPAPAKVEPAETAASPELTGEAIFKAHKCDSCHGTNGIGGSAPRLGGQNSTYLVDQLLRFRAGTRAHAPKMTAVAKQLDKKQIRAVAAFLGSQ
jgi:cytochrome c553